MANPRREYGDTWPIDTLGRAGWVRSMLVVAQLATQRISVAMKGSADLNGAQRLRPWNPQVSIRHKTPPPSIRRHQQSCPRPSLTAPLYKAAVPPTPDALVCCVCTRVIKQSLQESHFSPGTASWLQRCKPAVAVFMDKGANTTLHWLELILKKNLPLSFVDAQRQVRPSIAPHGC